MKLSTHFSWTPSMAVFGWGRIMIGLLGQGPPFSPRLVVSLNGLDTSALRLRLRFVHPLQDVALHQCLPLSSVCCLPNPGDSLPHRYLCITTTKSPLLMIMRSRRMMMMTILFKKIPLITTTTTTTQAHIRDLPAE